MPFLFFGIRVFLLFFSPPLSFVKRARSRIYGQDEKQELVVSVKPVSVTLLPFLCLAEPFGGPCVSRPSMRPPPADSQSPAGGRGRLYGCHSLSFQSKVDSFGGAVPRPLSERAVAVPCISRAGWKESRLNLPARSRASPGLPPHPASVRGGKMSPLLSSAVCLKNMAPL